MDGCDDVEVDLDHVALLGVADGQHLHAPDVQVLQHRATVLRDELVDLLAPFLPELRGQEGPRFVDVAVLVGPLDEQVRHLGLLQEALRFELGVCGSQLLRAGQDGRRGVRRRRPIGRLPDVVSDAARSRAHQRVEDETCEPDASTSTATEASASADATTADADAAATAPAATAGVAAAATPREGQVGDQELGRQHQEDEGGQAGRSSKAGRVHFTLSSTGAAPAPRVAGPGGSSRSWGRTWCPPGSGWRTSGS